VIILDTNVLSALMRTVPDPAVAAWLDRQPAESVWITSITLFETRFGLALLPSGRRRQALESAFEQLLKEDLENRVLADADRFAKNVAPIIREIQSSGVASHRAIARSLNARGVATARGGQWTAVQVGSILRRVVTDVPC